MPSEGTGNRRIARRSLLLGAGAAASAVALGRHSAAAAEQPLQPARPGKSGRVLNAYYLAANAYTIVPRRVREDMTWMASIGTTAVSISVLEQDFDDASYNIQLTIDEAKRAGITPYAVPSRWGGLVAGAPSVPSNFTETHADTWVLRSDGTPYTNSRGHRSDPTNPETVQFFKESTEKLLTQWPFEGIIWDEPKVDEAVDLFRQVSEHAKAVKPDVTVALFLDLSSYQGQSSDAAAEQFARIDALDYFGCDGSPWGRDDPADQKKVLLGGDGERFISMARRNGKRSFLLAETYALRNSVYPLVDQRFPEVVDLGSDCLSYYYFPRDVEDPDQLMQITSKHVRNYAG